MQTPQESRSLPILIVEDHPMMASSVQACLSALRPNATSIVASSLAQARDLMATRGEPRLIITDLNLPDSDGLETLAAVKAMAPHAKVVVFSALQNHALAQEALRMGANGVVAKSTGSEKFAEEILRWVDACGLWPAPMRSARVVTDDLGKLLSKRQHSVLALLANGQSNREIAQQLQVGESTVCTHVAEVLQRLGVKNRTQASARYLAWTYENGITT
jgi:DNA-binding NarL/FixJ family response regulator